MAAVRTAVDKTVPRYLTLEFTGSSRIKSSERNKVFDDVSKGQWFRSKLGRRRSLIILSAHAQLPLELGEHILSVGVSEFYTKPSYKVEIPLVEEASKTTEWVKNDSYAHGPYMDDIGRSKVHRKQELKSNGRCANDNCGNTCPLFKRIVFRRTNDGVEGALLDLDSAVPVNGQRQAGCAHRT